MFFLTATSFEPATGKTRSDGESAEEQFVKGFTNINVLSYLQPEDWFTVPNEGELTETENRARYFKLKKHATLNPILLWIGDEKFKAMNTCRDNDEATTYPSIVNAIDMTHEYLK